ncbi:S8 family serine peptidase [Tissierella sp. MSJ-40]|uniref:S8 family serine peptidase n=1 Tax=Tissierella simiarum TaxID=2841534 RepID=A0ABS6E315_9FIRM|nr:S8 family serine peptidase [Tissierella simiarum]MBU5436971.1 S8 family serine peptidase [Tissierella simiarum]
MKNIKKITSIILIFVLLMPTLVFGQENIDENVVESNMNNENIEELTIEETIELNKVKSAINRILGKDNEDLKLEMTDLEDAEVRVIIELEESPTIFYATERGIEYSSLSEEEVLSLENSLLYSQNIVEEEIKDKGIDFEIDKRFTTTFNGFSGEVNLTDIERIEEIPEVKKVYISEEYERPKIMPDMNSSNDIVRSYSAWDIGYKGEGMVVAVIDSGMDPAHKDMILSSDTKVSLDESKVNLLKNQLDLKGKYFTDKVPYGYNFYDKNYEIKDLGPEASEHGMHVAGTVGANGEVSEGGIKGVAPEAQILAMKVFSNDPIYATTFDDVYLEAIEEAIKLGANVLNMSLGSSASFYVENSPINIAITNAVENGIVCSISSGNAGQITYGWKNTHYGYPLKENPDIGVAGSPGLSYDSIQVASIENTHIQSPYLAYELEGEKKGIRIAITGTIIPSNYFSDKVEYVNCNFGRIEDFTSLDLEGKIALIIRGEIGFTDKIQNAQEAGATGVIVYNHVEGGEELVNMAYPEDGNIPAVFIGNQGGKALLELENKEVCFPKDLMAVPNPSSGKMAESSSWGTSPSLELKPEITAPGAKIYSTLQDNKYGTMSGTSMAAPHVSGGAALVTQYIKQNKDLKEIPLNDLLNYDNMDGTLLSLPGSTIIIKNKAFAIGLLEKENSVKIEKEIVNSRKNNIDIYVRLSTSKIVDLDGEVLVDLSKIPSLVTYMDIEGNETLCSTLVTENAIAEQTKLTKIILMNTSEIVLDEYGIPISPRRQGSGLMKLNDALNTPVIVVNKANNEAKVELKDFENTHFTFDLRVVNTFDKELTYNIEVDLLADYIHSQGTSSLNLLTARRMDGNIDVVDTITIPAKGVKDFTVKVDFSADNEKYRNMFVEGFVRLEETTQTYSNLSVPFVGFYGKWDEPEILDGFEGIDEISYYGYAGMINTKTEFMNPEKIYISPGTNSGKMFGNDTVTPILSFMRNAEEVKYNILDKDKKLIRNLRTEKFVKKTYIDGGNRLPYSYIPNRGWDGTAKGKVVEDGLYYYQVQSKIHYKDARWQEKNIPIYVDTTPPEINDLVLDDETNKLSWSVSDNLTEVSAVLVFLNNEIIHEELVKDKKQFEIDLSDKIGNLDMFEIQVAALDGANNIGTKLVHKGEDNNRPNIYLEKPDLLTFLNNKKVLFKGAIFDTKLTPTVKVDGKEAEVWFSKNVVIGNPKDPIRAGDAYEFSKVLTLGDGYHEIKVEAITNTGSQSDLIRRFYIDSTPPEIEVNVLDREQDSDKANLEITVRDNFPMILLYVNDSEIVNEELDEMKNIELTKNVEVDLEEGINDIPIKVIDAGGNVVEKVITIERKMDKEETIEDVENIPIEEESLLDFTIEEFVSEDLILPAVDDNGNKIVWRSDNSALVIEEIRDEEGNIVSYKGIIIRHEEDVEVTLEASVVIDEEAFETLYYLTVLKIEE